MEDFSVIHDRLLALVAPLTNFSDERISSAVFIILSLIAAALCLAGPLIPWRAMLLVGGWVAVFATHPASIKVFHTLDQIEIKPRAARTGAHVWDLAKADMILDEPPEVRQVEIFELQRQQGGAAWQTWVYSISPYHPLSPSRISGDRPRGTRFFEDVEPPAGWVWKDKKWSLDLLSREWVEERMITAVEIETEDERWVYDIAVSDGLAEHSSSTSAQFTYKQDWEESSGRASKGEWRRRRWVRLIQRKGFT